MTEFLNQHLIHRQNHFAPLIRVQPDTLRPLVFCRTFGGEDFLCTDWEVSELPDGIYETPQEAIDYRSYLAKSACLACQATGFEGGSPELRDLV